MTTELPLFPLHTVFFPRMLMPLHIFEDRYKVMAGVLHASFSAVRHRPHPFRVMSWGGRR